MDRILKNLEPERVFYYFEELTKIPHGSGNTKALSDYCVRFAEERGLFCRQDDLNNVIIVKEATEGYEKSPAVMLQGHLDMVCEKEGDTEHDFLTEPLKLSVEGDFISAKGTTLGGRRRNRHRLLSGSSGGGGYSPSQAGMCVYH